MMKVVKYRPGDGTRKQATRKQFILSKFYAIPFISRFLRKSLKVAFGLNESVYVLPGFHCDSAYLKVGKKTSLADLYIHGLGDVEIGNNVAFSKKCEVVTGTHDLSDFNIVILRPTIIEDYAVIGRGAVILDGVRVGRGAVVGAYSLVQKSIPPYAIVQGNPCKVVGFRYTPEDAAKFEEETYDETKRIPFEKLQSNYHTYFLKKVRNIKEFTEI